MKIEIEIPDLEEIFVDSDYYGDTGTVNGKDYKKALVNRCISSFMEELYTDSVDDVVREGLVEEGKQLIRKREEEIISKAIDKVADSICKKKAIVNEMPKKSEIANISKEWEDYFIELIDKAIAKRFK